MFISFSVLILLLYVDPEPLSVYHPTSEEPPTSTGALMEGFFGEADAVAKAMASASTAAAHGAPVEALVPPFEPIFTEVST